MRQQTCKQQTGKKRRNSLQRNGAGQPQDSLKDQRECIRARCQGMSRGESSETVFFDMSKQVQLITFL